MMDAEVRWRYVILTLLALGVAGCATAQPYSVAYKGCAHDNVAFALIPDFGITHDLHMKKCMRQEGWEPQGFGYRAAGR
jgi:hypothetical protein